MLTGPATETERRAQQWKVVHASRSASQGLLLVRDDSTASPVPPGWEERAVTLEELTMAYLRESGAATSFGPNSGSGADRSEVTR
jgi:hypothetical protein